MAEGLLREIGGDAFEVFSAGVDPSQVRPLAIEAMAEIGVDISGHRSKSVNEFLDQQFAYVITVCDHANERCPVFPGAVKRIHWSIDDPASAEGDRANQLAVFRRVRDELETRLRDFIKLHGQSTSHYENE